MGDTESIVLGGGCFWCLDASYRIVRGVTAVTSGYSGGNTVNPTMDQVYAGGTHHAEVVKVEFDPKTINLETILEIFWTIHDPTTLNRQGYDVGDEYRSVIFYNNDLQLQKIQLSKEEAKKIWGDKIVTEVVKLDMFYPADEDDQDYFEKYPEKAYCQIIINPKLTKLRKNFAKLMV